VHLGRLSQHQVQCPFCIPSANQLNINFLLHFLTRELLKSNLHRLMNFFFFFFPSLPIYRPSAFIFTSIFLLFSSSFHLSFYISFLMSCVSVASFSLFVFLPASCFTCGRTTYGLSVRNLHSRHLFLNLDNKHKYVALVLCPGSI